MTSPATGSPNNLVEALRGPDAREFQGGGNRPFYLEPGKAWVVLQGAIDLFLVRKRDGHPEGTHYPFRQVHAGRIMLGLPEDPRFAVLGVGDADARLLEVDRAAFEARPAEERAPYVEAWVQLLADGLDLPLPAPTSRVLTRDGEVQVPKGMQVTSRSEGVWLCCSRGSLDFPDGTVADLAPGQAVPLPRRFWLSAASDSLVAGQTTEEALADPANLERFHRWLLEAARAQARRLALEAEARVEHRLLADQALVGGAVRQLASVLPGGAVEYIPQAVSDRALLAACQLVGRAQGLAVRAAAAFDKASQPLLAIADASGFRVRRVTLRGRWWRTDSGPLLAFLAEGGAPVALLPSSPTSYRLVDPMDPRPRAVGSAVAATLSGEAWTFYRPFPDRAIERRDLVAFAAALGLKDLWTILVMGLLGGVLSLVTPIATGFLVNRIIPAGARVELSHLAWAMVASAVASGAYQLVRSIAVLRMGGHLDSVIQAAVIDRLLNLPAPFFRRFSTGDLANRALGINAIHKILSSVAVSSLLGGVFSMFSLALLFYYDWKLALVGLGLVVVNSIVIAAVGFYEIVLQRKLLAFQGRIAGQVFDLLSGIAKLRVAGAEARAFAQWASSFADQRRVAWTDGMVRTGMSSFNAFFGPGTTLVVFGFVAWRGYQDMDLGQFLSFFAAFGQLLGGLTSVSTATVGLLQIGPILDRAQPILREPLEVDEQRTEPGTLQGSVEFSHLSFRYRKDGQFILDDVSFRADPGEFVALVGPSGAGKSTLLRLALGFEQPELGAVYYDGQDLKAMNVHAVRRQMGVVLQNGSLLAGSIYNNIVGSSILTLEDAWAAAELAGLADDIRQMPMGMNTVLSEGGGTFSGGQRQRLMIARAVVARPRILFFDEATSALDAEVQEQVSRGLESLQATRVVIAHRLSTIRGADRIYVLNDHRIEQVGTFDELLNQPGTFRELALRQMT